MIQVKKRNAKKKMNRTSVMFNCGPTKPFIENKKPTKIGAIQGLETKPSLQTTFPYHQTTISLEIISKMLSLIINIS